MLTTTLTEQLQSTALLLAELRQGVIDRRIRPGMANLEQHLPVLLQLDTSSVHAARLIFQLAQWVDLGWRDISVVESLLARVPHQLRSCLTLRDYAAIRASEGMVAISHEDLDSATRHFDAVLSLREDIEDREVLAITFFWKARCQRKRGEYDKALANTIQARDLALECGFDRMAAVMRVLESWLYFQAGKHKDALAILAEADTVLQDTDDAVVLGNIQSTYGRVYRQEGRYDRAIVHFSNAIEEYRKIDTRHPNLARTLANIAYVKRLVGLDLRRKIDAGLSRKRHAGETALDPRLPALREQFERLRDEAFQHLEEAALIYKVHPNHRGSGTVHLNCGLLHFDNGALDQAEDEALAAFALGEEKDDAILRARARLLQCMVENAKLEEGIEEDPQRHAEAALDYIRDALEFARTTQNRRLLARVHTWHGLTLSNEFFSRFDAAVEAMNSASAHLDHGFHDTAWEDLRMLKARVAKSHTIDETLLAWSQGAVGDRTFREIEEQFAEILIPKVWQMEGRRIARVAAKLSISPKKVRRALSRAGLLRTEPGKAGASNERS